ncbi:hypothetical protein DUNSADRAFT_2427 [Dunaliella salina]|uniref:ENT domain-containing protein n=1 Tax=Dunaliella salina TaxID=3046 RepID=A0ABQ7GVM9_DUNSA|nr:hypothetical protein DUNSADRAFT_2427 [Dunaliella salina]|eukprot:KAF5838663.1 hypothetical protein DUNSADRAFT_2427 [Dunaliella salina]
MNLESAAYYAIARAFVAGNKLNFDTEALLGDLAKALNLDDDTCTDLLCQADGDPEACLLKQYDKSIVGAPHQATAAQQPRPAISSRPVQSAVPATAAPAAYADPTYTQPPKKQKKAAAAPAAATPATAPRASRPAPSSKSRAPARSAPTTPAAGVSGAAIAGSRAQQPKPKMGISVQALQRAMHRGQSEMQNYLNELNLREREIFTELINLGVDENSSDLSEVHRALLQWYKLDNREVAIEQEILALAVM